jgi:hypothetical protein
MPCVGFETMICFRAIESCTCLRSLGYRDQLLDINQAEIQLTVTQAYCNYNTSQLQTMMTPHKLKVSLLTPTCVLSSVLLYSAFCCLKKNKNKKKWRVVVRVVRDTTWGRGVRNYISDFEGSQAVLACPSGIARAYNRTLLYFCDARRGAL